MVSAGGGGRRSGGWPRGQAGEKAYDGESHMFRAAEAFLTRNTRELHLELLKKKDKGSSP